MSQPDGKGSTDFRPWEQWEIDLIFKGGMSNAEIAKKIGRTRVAIKSKKLSLRKMHMVPNAQFDLEDTNEL